MNLKERTMKLSDNTLNVLKNFAGINNSILVKEGNKLRTISVAKNILAEANITEEFPRDVAIYDLNQFLNGLSLHADPDLDFKFKDCFISSYEGETPELLNFLLINKSKFFCFFVSIRTYIVQNLFYKSSHKFTIVKKINKIGNYLTKELRK